MSAGRGPARPERGILLLVLGATAGIALAAAGLVAPAGGRTSGLPHGAVARVNQRLIRVEDYERMLEALAGDRRGGPAAGDEMPGWSDAPARREAASARAAVVEADRRRVLDRLIDEELLVQRGLELGLVDHDARVRKDLAAAVIDAVVAAHADAAPTAAELHAFYEEHRDFFARPGRLRVRQIWVRAGTGDEAPARERAAAAAGRLRAGEPFAGVRAALGDDEIVALPDAPLPPGKLLDYLGPTALRVAVALEVGAVSDPVRSGTGYHVLQVTARLAEAVPPLAGIESEVVAEFRRRAGERALRAALDALRARAEIEVAPGVP